MSQVSDTLSGPTYWRSLQELAQSPEFLAELGPEFSEDADLPPQGTSRRRFLQVMAASVSLAGLTGCRWPKEKIFPYANNPDNRTPGTPVQYATCLDLDGAAKGLLATSYDGRPTKIDGNNLHPDNRGANDVIAEASILELYDPDRSRVPTQLKGSDTFQSNWDEFLGFARTHFSACRQAKGSALAVLSESSSSPTVERLKSQFRAVCPQAKWYEYEPVSRDNERMGAHLAFGQVLRPHYHLDQARVVVTLDEDLFRSHPAAVALAKDFVKGRAPENGSMNRLYAIESNYSLTGAMADHRYPVPSSLLFIVLGRLAIELAHQGLQSPYLPPPLIQVLLTQTDQKGLTTPYIPSLAKDLLANKGAGLVVTGPSLPVEVQALAHLLNAALENTGKTITYTADPDPERPPHRDALAALVKDLNEGKVDTLVILGGNPVYNFPADQNFRDALTKVKSSFHLSLYRNETSRLCTWHVPRAHYLESWGDGRAWDGTICAAQPLIRPLYDGKSVIEFLSLMSEDTPRAGYELVRETVLPLLPGTDPETAWRMFLNNGIQEGTQFPVLQSAPKTEPLVQRLTQTPFLTPDLSPANLEAVFVRHPSIHDGRFANNGWLQELPDFMTKLTWDNAALLSPATARELGIEQGDLVRLKLRDSEIEMAAYLLPGHALNSVTLYLGYGRTAAGRVGNGVGFDTYRLRHTQAMDIDTGLTIESTGSKHLLACTMDHHAIDTIGMKGRAERTGTLVREATLEEYKHHADFAKHVVHKPDFIPLWQPYAYEGQKWGLAIDLQKCIGCNACVISCQAENNIPVVGKEQVSRQREMHWIRVDRYFKGEPEAPEVAYQPVACVHCENAPCEQVCPVGATVHDHDGLNVMVYNRCVGTRYCSNNCPYKVRRFNFFHYNGHYSATEKMVFNPEVTVRSRGVMEKCTYCVQRIQRVKIAARNESRPIQDGEIRTACQVACPTEAIIFGDLNDPNSRVAKLHKDPRSYLMLEELNVAPRTAHLARVRNPNPELTEAMVHEPSGHS